MTSQEILQQCTVDGYTVKLPNIQLDRNVYLEVAKKLELIGGKWNRKQQGFLFQQDPTDLLAQIAGGEKRNLKKEFQFFATPDSLADRLVNLADIKPSDKVLEPSAGQGAIIRAINRKYPQMQVDCYELMDINRNFLAQIPTANLLGNDFLAESGAKKYDKIIANPPFAKNQDIEHIRKMWELLKKGGKLVAIASIHWRISSNRKEKDFAEWLDKNEAQVIDVDAGAFKESKTNIPTCIIILQKTEVSESFETKPISILQTGRGAVIELPKSETKSRVIADWVKVYTERELETAQEFDEIEVDAKSENIFKKNIGKALEMKFSQWAKWIDEDDNDAISKMLTENPNIRYLFKKFSQDYRREKEAETEKKAEEMPQEPAISTSATIRKNAERNGIEIVFVEKPNENVLKWLKDNDYFWHRTSKFWYTKYTDAKMLAAKQFFSQNTEQAAQNITEAQDSETMPIVWQQTKSNNLFDFEDLPKNKTETNDNYFFVEKSLALENENLKKNIKKRLNDACKALRQVSGGFPEISDFSVNSTHDQWRSFVDTYSLHIDYRADVGLYHTYVMESNKNVYYTVCISLDMAHKVLKNWYENERGKEISVPFPELYDFLQDGKKQYCNIIQRGILYRFEIERIERKTEKEYLVNVFENGALLMGSTSKTIVDAHETLKNWYKHKIKLPKFTDTQNLIFEAIKNDSQTLLLDSEIGKLTFLVDRRIKQEAHEDWRGHEAKQRNVKSILYEATDKNEPLTESLYKILYESKYY